jgi:dTMP kinase
MADNNGIFIVLEGADGSGKTTQFRLLTERLKAVGYDVEIFKFPQYDQPSSHFVNNYLNGRYGPAGSISPYKASLFYALDRFEAAPKIREALNQGKVVLSDRYVGSNMAHQGGKLPSTAELRGFFIWDDGLEFDLLGIPRPSINIFLRVPVEISLKLMQKDKRDNRQYTKETHDEHEKDIEHLRKSVATYNTLCQLFPKDFYAIECVKDAKLLSIADINDKIWDKIKPMLPKKPPNASRDIVVQLEEQQKQSDHQQDKLNNEEHDEKTATASSRSDKYISININRVSLLALGAVQAEDKIKVEINSIEWPRNDQYKYYSHARLPKNVATVYSQSMEKLSDLHREMLKKAYKQSDPSLITAINSTIPMAALASIQIDATANDIRKAASQLQVSTLEESRWLAQQLLSAAAKASPDDFKGETAHNQDGLNTQKSQVTDVITKLVAEHLPQTLPANTEPVNLLEVRPRNEFDLLVDSIYPYSESSRSDIAATLQNWPYEQKTRAITAAALQSSSPLFSQVKYLWNVICERETFGQINSAISLEHLQLQAATPRYGYNVPESIEQANLDDLFIECFDESLKLYSSLQAAGIDEIAPYATLMGHKNRWQFSTSAEAHKKQRPEPISDEAIDLLNAMLEKISEAHPIIGGFLQNIELKTKPQNTGPKKNQDKAKKLVTRQKRRARKKK